MKPISVGEARPNEKIFLDLEKENSHFIFLGGGTGTGKSIFRLNIYKQLIENNSADEVGIIPLDFKQVDLSHWKGDYILTPPTYDTDTAFAILEDLAKNPGKYGDKKVFVHIDENELALKNNERFVRAIRNIKEKNANVYILYATSRLLKEFIEPLLDLIDIKVIFATYTSEESMTLLGTPEAGILHLGEKIAMIHDKEIFLKPLKNEEVKEILDFVDKMSGAE